MSDRIEFKVEPATGMTIGPDGMSFENEQDAIYYGVLNLCGCGDPESLHAFLLECLQRFDGEYPKDGVDGIRRVIEAVPAVAAEFIAHYLDSVGLTEHGGSVYGSWLTDLGKQALEIGATRPGNDD